VDWQEDFEARLEEGRTFAPTLVGLECDAAVERVTERGFDPQVVPHTAEAVTADLGANRIRLFLDEQGMVVRATAG